MKKVVKNVFNQQELKSFWDEFQIAYTKHIPYNLENVFVSMCSLTGISSNKNYDNILELACGSGTGLNYLSNIMRGRSANIYGTDLSKDMLNACWENIKGNTNANIYYDNKKVDNQKSLNINISEDNNENLSSFKNEQFDAVISNFSLNLVTNPENMIKEASRVLKPNGSACFSIWGRPENSQVFSIIPQHLKKFNIKLPEHRSNFHLSKIEKIKSLILENGFNKFYYCYTFCPFNFYDSKDFLFYLDTPMYKQIFDSITDEKLKAEIVKSICSEIDELINKENQFFGTEAIILMGKKV